MIGYNRLHFLLISFMYGITVYGQEGGTQQYTESPIRESLYSISVTYPTTLSCTLGSNQESVSVNINSLVSLGFKAMWQKKWGNAAKWFENIVKQDPDHLQALYGLGICKREIGAKKALLQRYLDWRSSEKHFKRVIALDSTFQDVFYQMALLERYRKHYDRSIGLAHRQLSMNRAWSVQIGIFRLYDSMLGNESYKKTESWLKSRSTMYDIYALGELYRRHDQLERADSIFQMVLSDSSRFPRQPLLLSLVRLHVQRGELQEAHDTYWQAVEQIDSNVDADHHLEDIMPIVNDEEYKIFKSTQSLILIQGALRVFWTRRDPLPAASYNRRLIEHYNRIHHAEANYRYDGFRHPMAKSDRLNVFQFPPWYFENFKFEDRGLIYIRFGEPDDKAFAVDASVPPNISWLYYAREDMEKMIFHFSIPQSAPPGYWTLSPGFSNPEVVESMLTWDNLFSRLKFAHSEGEQYAIMHEMAVTRASTVNEAFKTDRHSWPEKTEVLDMDHITAQFRETDREDILQLAYAIPLSSIFEEEGSTDSVRFETGVTVLDTQMVALFKDVRQFVIIDHTDSHVWGDLFIDEFEFPLGLEPHNVAIHARILGMNKLNGWKYVCRLTDAHRDRLACSTLKLAFDISHKSESNNRHRDDLNIIPNPTKRFKKEDPIFTYYEIYYLVFDESGKTDYTVNFTLRRSRKKKNVFQRIAGIFGGGEKYQVSVQSDQTGTSRTVTDFISFDVSRAKEGEYELKLELKDNVSGEVTSVSADLVLN